MRIGLLGGTFDPVHVGHLILAELSREEVGLEEVWFLPANQPPHKRDRELTPFGQRVEMLQLALAGNAAFQVCEIEKERPGPSFTVDTLEELTRRHPSHDWFLLIGSDTLADLPNWRQPERVVAGATLVVMERPAESEISERHVSRISQQVWEASTLAATSRLIRAPSPLVGISSRELRRRVHHDRSIRYQVPRSVEMYIKDKGLYRS